MKKPPPTPTIDPMLLAVAERGPDAWRVLLVERSAQPRVRATREFSANDESGLAAWLESERCGDLRIVLPASATIVRSVQMPSAAPMQMLSALRLQAEGMFLGSVPIVRIGLAVLDGEVDGERQGLILAWPESQIGVGLGAKLESIARYIPEPAAMLVLAASGKPAIAADQRDGSISIALRGTSGMVLRATRESSIAEGSDESDWRDGLRRALVETALNAGVEPARVSDFATELESAAVRSGSRITMLHDDSIAELRGRINAPDRADEWWREWVIPLAAATVACGPLQELSQLRRFEEREAPSGIERFVERYSQPARALRVAVAAFLVVALAPYLAALARVQVLEMKMPEKPSRFELAQRQVEHRISLYEELSKRTVPVTKILGDLACCTPDGIEIEDIQVSPTQGIALRGVAKAVDDRSAAQIVNEMAQMLDASGVFDKTQWRWNQPDGRGIFKFDMDSLIARPTYLASPKEGFDWSKQTLAQKKYGTAADGDDGRGQPAAAATGSGIARAGDTASASNDGSETSRGETTANSSATTAPRGEGATRPSTIARGEANGGTPDAGTSAPLPARGIGRRDTQPAGETGSAPATASSGAGAGGGPAAVAQANLRVPDPFTDEALAAMSKDEARALLSDVSKARRRADLDAETRQRLGDDFNRILERLRKEMN